MLSLFCSRNNGSVEAATAAMQPLRIAGRRVKFPRLHLIPRGPLRVLVQSLVELPGIGIEGSKRKAEAVGGVSAEETTAFNAITLHWHQTTVSL